MNEQEPNDDSNRRIKSIAISEQAVLSLFRAFDFRYFRVPRLGPDGAKVIRAFHSLDRGCFIFIVQHESFPVVPDNEYPGELTYDPLQRERVVEVFPVGEIDKRIEAAIAEDRQQRADASAARFDDVISQNEAARREMESLEGVPR